MNEPKEPTCGKCGEVMTPADSRIRPELFLHDACLPDELKPATAGKPRKQSMLYEVCPHCNGAGGTLGNTNLPCCKMLGVVETGATAGQLNYLVNLDALRQEAGISAAMLRDGRAKQMVEATKEKHG